LRRTISGFANVMGIAVQELDRATSGHQRHSGNEHALALIEEHRRRGELPLGARRGDASE
jgi:hypothetical protein